MKGDSGAAVLIIILIVVGVGALFLFSGNNQFFSSFGLGGNAIVYSNDVITVYDKFVADEAPYDGQKTTIEFAVRNAGKGTAKGVEVALEPPTGFTSSIKCGDLQSCKFDLEEGDATEVLITLTAISQVGGEPISQILPVDVRYSVKYPYQGEREVHIPIVKDKDELPKGQTFFVSDSTYGPIQLSIATPEARNTPTGGSAVYAISGIPVRLDFSVNDVGSGGFGTVKPVVMQGDDLKLTLTNLATIFCDKIDSATNTLKIKDTGGTIFAKVGETVPFDVSCSFDPTAKEDVTDGVIKINFKYNYEISFTSHFNILPRNVPEIEGGGATASGTQASGGTEVIGPPAAPTTTTTGGGGTPTTTGGLPTQISVSTDKSSYSASQTIKITGSLTPGYAGLDVTGIVSSPNAIYKIYQIKTDSSGAFSTDVVLPASSALVTWGTGTWKITASYNNLKDEKTVNVS